MNHPEICREVLEILTSICWICPEGYIKVMETFEFIRVRRNLKLKYSVLFDVLNKSKNILIIECVLNFFNIFVESIIEDDKRDIVRAEIVSSGIKKCFLVFYLINFFILLFF